MPINLIAHDTRLEGRTPPSVINDFFYGTTVSTAVDSGIPLAQFFDRVNRYSDNNGGINRLFIMAHGVYLTSSDSHAIQFCQEFIHPGNVDSFSEIRGKVERIILYACNAAETDLTEGDVGDETCRRMAIAADAEVTAGRDIQHYGIRVSALRNFLRIAREEEARIDFGAWEGTVVVYDRNGRIVRERHYPRAWRDASGVIHDPRAPVWTVDRTTGIVGRRVETYPTEPLMCEE